jgi:Na+/proline symporter
VYLAGAALALGVIIWRMPEGWSQIAAFGAEHDKFRVFDFSFDLSLKYTFWAGILGGMFLTMGTHGADQLMVQRYLSARSQRDAAAALALSGLVVLGQFVLFLLVGVGLAAFYRFVAPGAVFEKDDEVFATFIVHEMPVGAVGVALAAALAAAMSTLSSSLNSSAAAAVNDLYLPLRKTEPAPEYLVRLSRILTIVFGLVQIGVGLVGRYFASNVVNDVLAIAGFTTGIILGVFFLGILTRHVTQRSALVGLAGGIAVMTAVKFATPLAWPWYTIVGATATLGLGLAASLFKSFNATGRNFGKPP